MTTTENSSLEWEILIPTGTPENGQIQQPDSNIPTEQYKSLQSEFTRSRQSLIEATTLLAKNDPTYLSTIKDTKLQNTVVKDLYGFETYSQAVAVLWSDFNTVKDGNEWADDIQRLEREIKLLKYNEQRGTVENELRNYKLANPHYFTNEGSEDKLRAELQYISWELPIAERIKRASAIAFIPPVDPTTQAYQALNSWVGWNGWNGKINSVVNDSEKQKQIEAGRKLFGLK